MGCRIKVLIFPQNYIDYDFSQFTNFDGSDMSPLFIFSSSNSATERVTLQRCNHASSCSRLPVRSLSVREWLCIGLSNALNAGEPQKSPRGSPQINSSPAKTGARRVFIGAVFGLVSWRRKRAEEPRRCCCYFSSWPVSKGLFAS